VAEASDATVADNLGRKRQVYAAGCIPKYWVVDPAVHAFPQYGASLDGSSANEAVVPFGGRLSAATLPHLGIDLAAPDDGD
jgi:Uma2 family endonuclease